MFEVFNDDAILTDACVRVNKLWWWDRHYETRRWQKAVANLRVCIDITMTALTTLKLPQSFRLQLIERVSHARSLYKKQLGVTHE